MKLWYKAVCDQHNEACDVFNNNPSMTANYLSDKNEIIENWLWNHYKCELRLVWRDDQLDKLWETIDPKTGIVTRPLVKGK